MAKSNPRALAVSILEKVAVQGSYSNLTLDATLRHADLSVRDAHLLTTIVYGVIQRRLTLDYDLQPFVGKRRLDPWVRVLLQTAVYQMVYLDKVPTRAIFYETTEIAKQKGHAGIAKFVTAILRRIQREGLPSLDAIQSPLERLSIASSTPMWLVEKLVTQLGQVKAERILAVINQPANASLRVNTTKTTASALQAQLQDRFPELAPSALTPDGLVAPGGHLAGTPEFAAGLYTLQDESSMLVAPSLAVAPEMHVLDACAAPGGKTTHIAQLLDPDVGGKVTALDLHPHKVRLIAENAARLGLADRVDAYAMDARQAPDQFAPQSFDRVLVDAPCSGLGLIRRKPEIKYEKQPADLVNLPKIQLAILEAVAGLVKAGGRLTYSTCTIVREENQAVIDAFLVAHPEFTQIQTPTAKGLTKAHGALALQLYPDDYGTDGFYIAALQRRA
ncbi:MAG: 16S rRNA (cytosine(967)-C(5))-methyltransferase RsmB [Lactobacillus sp.]|nr:16S rRNA (cytosine(967)-C(5))-methyltransferase RsmB [Lactobacillus sp.]MCI2032252.1 16S rRNA (cytosine(967)-C(5))-methyltransferase RsmB [Lactobacillus sp.]